MKRLRLNQNVNNVDLNSLLKDSEQSSHVARFQTAPTTSIAMTLLPSTKNLHTRQQLC
ncbi:MULTISPECIES: hypothetical protein [Pseudomonas]|jgi:hypothetical protein|uniref:hypothetical protein n=1 Tax=Pseudomonas TaxID=286 RepID=UPI0012B5BE24|nr:MULTISPECIES: hypothetical protein [Pseudomonas]MBP1121517.1 hypothetical protein [Pseudomonas sp. PvP028]QVI78708.1 hypothetical protein KHW15_17000 [Pseudomonas syringae]